jgi:hypothetical protein
MLLVIYFSVMAGVELSRRIGEKGWIILKNCHF